MWLDSRFQASLRRSGLSRFEAVMDSSAGRCLRVLKARENWYLGPDAFSAPAVGMYLKKHRVRTWSTRVRATLNAGPGVTAAGVEAENALALTALGLDVMPLVAYGEKLRADGVLESFLLTEELAGYMELQAFLRQRFPASPARRDPDLQRIVVQVARIARLLHGAGYNHRDFYCCHFLIKELSPGAFDIRLIDLQRAERRRWFRRRWIVKDLAQLAYSAPHDRIGCKQQIALHAPLSGRAQASPRRQASDPRSARQGAKHATTAGGGAMRIGLVVERFDPLRGGLEQWTYRFAHQLARRGHEIHVVSREFSERTRTLPMIAHRVERVRSPLDFAAAAETTLAALELDVIHDMGVGWYCDILHPHGGSWASVAARKLLLLPRVAATAEVRAESACCPAIASFTNSWRGSMPITARSWWRCRDPWPTISRDSTRLLPSASASSTTAWTASVFRRNKPRRTARPCAAAWASSRKRSSC